MKLELGIEREKLKRYNKKNELPMLAVSAAVCFTLFFFPAMEIYLGNPHDFTVPAAVIIFPMLLAALAGTAVAMLLLNLILYLSEAAVHFIISLAVGLNLAAYSQLLFMNGRMTALTGDYPEYAEPSPENTRNLIVYLCIAAVPVIGFIAAKLIPKKSAGETFCRKIIPFAALVPTVMQLAGFAGNVAKYGIPDYKEDEMVTYLSYEQATQLSPEKNVIVFVTDRLDGEWMSESLEKYPELYDMLEGFTFYSDNVSNYTNTFPSAAYMLTKHQYNAEDWDTYFDDAWAGDSIPKTLKNNGYNVYLIPDTPTTIGNAKRIKDFCDNKKTTRNDLRYNLFSYNGVISTMTDFSLARLLPYSFKTNFIVNHSSSFSSDFSHYPDYMTDRIDNAVSNDSDVRFYEYIKEHELTNTADKPVFSFVHLDFAHDVSDVDSALWSGFSGQYDKYTAIRGSFEIINEYLRQMKENGTFDNSTIILLGDHGRAPIEIEVGEKDFHGPITTALMIKTPGAERKPLVVDDSARLSNEYLPDSILEYAGLSVSGDTFQKLLDSGEYPPRYMDVYHWRSFNDVFKVTSYEINGDSHDFSNWKRCD
ncbi:MAG: sulfatase-like hydrolase/transferase [Ruminococcus sp.]|nr:sulfatase-like hydrolase/transferase [Ruminococcus sp.]